MKTWPIKPVKEICSLVVDCVNKTAPVVDFDTPYKMIRTTNIRHGRVNMNECRNVTQETYLKWTRRAKVLAGDVLLTREAPLGEVGYIHNDTSYFLGQRIMQYRANKDIIEPRYLYYAFRSKFVQDQIHAHSGTGSVVDHIRVPDCEKFLIPIPPKDIQTKIIKSVGTIDDKIELNNQMNKTLESMAKIIFKEWFIDFGPVKAKIEGKTPFGMDDETAALFPNSFENSQLGKIPKGWRINPLGEIIDLIGGGTPKTSVENYWNGNIPWFSVVDTPKGSDVWVIDTEKKISQDGVDNSSTKILPVGTTIISARGTVGNLALVGTPTAMNQSCYGIRGKGFGDYFVYLTIANMVLQLKQNSHGSVFDTITRETFNGVAVATPLPSDLILKKFEAVISSLFEKIKNNVFESRTLTQTRDLLLPKLISGELDV